MNFDELKKQWDNQSADEVEVNPEFEKTQEANTIIDKVRKVMKKDFYFQLTSFPIIIAYPFLFELNSPMIWWIVTCICFIMIVPLFYLVKFYKSSYRLEYNSLRNINWFYYNFKSSVTIFSLYTYTISILCILFIGAIAIEKNSINPSNFNLIFMLIFIPLYVVICIWILKWWIKKLYLKPLLELENIVNQLEE